MARKGSLNLAVAAIARKLTVASQAITMALAADEKTLYVLGREPRLLVAVELDDIQPAEPRRATA